MLWAAVPTPSKKWEDILLVKLERSAFSKSLEQWRMGALRRASHLSYAG